MVATLDPVQVRAEVEAAATAILRVRPRATMEQVVATLDDDTRFAVRRGQTRFALRADAEIATSAWQGFSLAERKLRDRVIAEEAKDALRYFEVAALAKPVTWETVVARALREARARLDNCEVERFRVEEAVKARLTIGRCAAAKKHAYFWRKGKGRTMREVPCPHCGGRLVQTQLALRATFYMIPKEG